MPRDEPGRPLPPPVPLRLTPPAPSPSAVRPVRVRAALLTGGLAALLLTGPVLVGTAGPADAWSGPGAHSAGLAAGTEPSDDPPDPPDPPLTESPDPGPSTTPPTNTDSPSPAGPSPTPGPPSPGTSSPAAPSPPPGSPTPPPRTPGQPGPQQPGPDRLGVYVTTNDITLPESYWSADSTTADLRVTIANTGDAAEAVRLSYALPDGVTDAGTRGCQTEPGGGECTAWSVPAGARFTTHLRLRIDGAAWRHMPLSGSVQATASGADSATVTDTQGFAVLFPAGPPAPGMSLSAGDVNFDITGQATTLDVRLGNTGRADAAGTIEVVLPAGVTVPSVPAGCVAAGDRTRCDLGVIGPGQVGTARLPVAATPEAQRTAPLSGAVVGTLAPRAGKPKTIQMSFRITAMAALSTEAAGTDLAPTGSQGALPPMAGAAHNEGLSGTRTMAIALIGASLLLVLLALALAARAFRGPAAGEPPPADARVVAE